jgi:hypothetical protein
MLLLAASSLLLNAAHAQVSSYTYSANAGTYTEITGGLSLGTESSAVTSVYADGTTTPATSNNYYWQVAGAGFPIGFNFNYNGQNFDRLGVSGTGWIALGKSANGATAVTVFTHTNASWGPLNHSYASGQANVIPPADRLNNIAGLAATNLGPAGAGSGASLRLETIGSAPDRICVVQWTNFRRGAFFPYANERISFQIRLHETTNAVEVQLKDPAAGWLGDYGATQIGLRGAAATVAATDFSTLYTPYDAGLGAYDWAQLALAPAQTASYRAFIGTAYVANLPANGTIYRWVPPTCPGPSNVQLATIGANSVTLTWNGPTGSETYDYAINTVNSPTTGTPITGGGVTGTSVVASGLASNTVYYAFVRKNCGGGDYSGWALAPNRSVTSGSLVLNAFRTAAGCGEAFDRSYDFIGGGGPIESVWTICAANAGDVAKVTFSAFNMTNSNSALYVYDGPSTASPLISSGQPAQGAPGNLAGGFYGSTVIGPFTSAPDGCLTFRYVSSYAGDSWTSQVTCQPAPTCFPPTGISVATTTQGGTFTWTGVSANYEYVVVLDGQDPSATPVASGTTSASTVVVSSLLSNTAYTLFVRGVCGVEPGDISDWSFGQDFRTLVGCGSSYDGFRSTYVSYPNSMDSVITICPDDLGDVTTVTFNFFSFGQNGDDAMYVYDGPTTGATLLASTRGATSEGFPAGGYYGNFTAPGDVNFPGPFTSTHSSGCITLRFRTSASGGSFYDSGWESDVTCAPAPACATPSAVTISAIGGTNATVSWVGDGLNYILEYGAPGFTPGTGAAAGSGSSTVISGVTSPYTLNTLTATTSYKVVVRRVCGATYSANSFPTNFGTSMDCSTAQVIACGELTTATITPYEFGNALYQNPYYTGASCIAAINGDGQERLYRFTAPQAGTYRLNLPGTMTSSQAGFMSTPVANGCGAAAFSCIGLTATSPNWPYGGAPSAIDFNLAAGDHYIMLDASAYAQGTLPFQLFCPGVPPCITAPTFPANNTTLANNSTPIAFSWPAAFGATAYDVYFMDALVAANITATNITSPSYTPAAIAGIYGIGTTINWRVVPKNADGTAACATNWTFKVGGNGNANAIPLANGVATGGSNRPTYGYSNLQSTYWGNDVTFSFNTTACAVGVDIEVCMVAYTSQNYPIVEVRRAADGVIVGSSLGTLSPPACRSFSISGANIEAGQSYYLIVDGYSGQFDFTIEYNEVLSTSDLDGDGLLDCADSCPETAGSVGDTCYAGPLFANSVINEDCECAGTPVPCTTDLTLEFQTDGNPFENSWELIEQGTDFVVQSGGSLNAPGGVETNFTCLPDGCFYLRVYDSAGDGMTTGGYIFRTLGTDQRIIDNRNNFSTGSVSAISGGQGFCLPISNDKVAFTSCDKLDWVNGQFVVASPNPAVSAQWVVGGANSVQDNNSGYEFWIFDPNGSYSFRRFRSHNVSDGFGPASATRACHMKLNNWALASHVPANKLMNVRVRARINGVNGEFGPACRLAINPTLAACPQTHLMDIPGNQYYSCGATRQYGAGNYVHARPVSGANRYQFRFRIAAEGFEVVRTATTYFVQLNWTGATALQDGKTYDVDVRVSKDAGATWCSVSDPWGTICQLTIDNTPANSGDQNFAAEGMDAELRLFPNPNRGDVLNFSLSAIEEGVNTVSVDIYDLTGKRMSARTIAVSGGNVNTVLDLNGELAAGLYLVNITAGNTTYTERLVIQP